MTRTVLALLLAAVVVTPARSDDPPKPPTPEERAAKAEAEVKKLKAELDAAKAEVATLKKREAERQKRQAEQLQKLLEETERVLERNRAETERTKKVLEFFNDAVKGDKRPDPAADPAIRPFLEGRPIPPVPEGARGTVTATSGIDPDTKVQGDLVQVNIGLNAGLTRGMVLDIYRLVEKDHKYLGTVTVDTVYPKHAVAVFKPAGGKKLTDLKPGDFPKVGDTVGKITAK